MRADARAQIAKLAETLEGELWSKSVEREVRQVLDAAQKDINAATKEMKRSYRDLFAKTAAGVTVGALPLVVCNLFPGMTGTSTLLLGAGLAGGGLLVEPLKGLLEIWFSKKPERTAMSSFFLTLQRARRG